MGSAKKDVTHAGKTFACVTFFKPVGGINLS